ncbi:MAG: hypothetical protein R6U10_04310 [Thermoplasmatota archaeon]
MREIGLVFAVCIVIVSGMFVHHIGSIGTTDDRDRMPHFHLQTALPAVEAREKAVYAIAAQPFNASLFRDIAATFALYGEIQFINESYMPSTYMTEGTGNKVLEYHLPTGAWIYVNPSRAYHPTENEDIPSDEEARHIAESFLKKQGFWAKDIHFWKTEYKLQGKGVKNGNIISEEVFAKRMYFTRDLDGMMLRGVGAKCCVTVASGGDIVSFIQPMHEYRKIGMTSIMSPKAAFEKLEQGIDVRGKTRARFEGRDIDIQNVSLCYHVESLLKNSSPVTPCYVFEGMFHDNGNTFRAFVDATI